MTIDPTMETVDGEQRWYRIDIGRRVLHAGQELTFRYVESATDIRVRFRYAAPSPRRLVCVDADGRELAIDARLVRTIHRTRKLEETDR